MEFLSRLDVGEECIVTGIEGGIGLRHNLSLRDIREGVRLRVVSSRGRMTVEVGRSMVSIGRGMAEKIKVRVL